MKSTGFVLTMLVLFFAGCAPFNGSLKEGEAMPEGKVLLVGSIALDPPLEQGTLVSYDVRGASRGIIRFGVTKDTSKKVDLKSVISMSFDEVFLMNMQGLSCIPLQPGTRYLRVGIMDLSSHYSMPIVDGAAPGARGVEVTSLQLIKDLKVEIPNGVKAVYIGTLVFRHDGRQATSVQVRNDFKQAVKELATKHIPGLSPKDMVKKLAQVVKD
jgi:hypothetical protein